jgi:predicted AAA+ superfamily ATPase
MDFIKEIIKQNTFWIDNKVNIPRLTGKWINRDVEGQLMKLINTKFITVLKGMRATGKSSLIKKYLQDCINRGDKTEDFGFFEFDRAMNANVDNLDEILTYFISRGVKTILIDEVHFVSQWQDVLKRFYDRTDVKFIVSGSSALELDSRSAESLAGRFNLLTVKPFSFREFLNYKNINNKNPESLLLNEGLIFQEMEKYILFGGFPEVVMSSTEEDKIAYIKSSILDPVFYKDLPIITGENPDLLSNTLRILSASVGSVFQTQSIAALTGLNIPSAFKSIESLERSLIVKVAYNQSGSVIKKGRVAKKIIFNDNGILKSLREDIPISILAENIAGSFFSAKEFYRDSAGREIDWLLPEEKTAVEIKYSDNITDFELRHLKYFLTKNPDWKGILISKNTEKIISGIKITPLWKLLLLPEITLSGKSS